MRLYLSNGEVYALALEATHTHQDDRIIIDNTGWDFGSVLGKGDIVSVVEDDMLAVCEVYQANETSLILQLL